MPAPLGNTNAESAWFTPVDPNERTVQVAGRIVESQHKAIAEIAKRENLTKSAIIREALEMWLREKQKRTETYPTGGGAGSSASG